MSLILRIKDEDVKRIERLQILLSKKSKMDVIQDALTLLEDKVYREKIERYRRAAKLAAGLSREVNKLFRPIARIRNEI